VLNIIQPLHPNLYSTFIELIGRFAKRLQIAIVID